MLDCVCSACTRQVNHVYFVDARSIPPTNCLLDCADCVKFAQVLDNGTVRVRTWERGSQETQACGTGACATVYALCAQGITPPRNAIDDGKDLRMHMVNVELLGGSLTIACDPEHGNVMMTGPAVKVFDGVITVR